MFCRQDAISDGRYSGPSVLDKGNSVGILVKISVLQIVDIIVSPLDRNGEGFDHLRRVCDQ
jgi:hypothetical protein